jgi:hypothetical protein
MRLTDLHHGAWNIESIIRHGSPAAVAEGRAGSQSFQRTENPPLCQQGKRALTDNEVRHPRGERCRLPGGNSIIQRKLLISHRESKHKNMLKVNAIRGTLSGRSSFVGCGET